jgi:archaellum biogenesis protein FlaJ (TadC family)
MELISAMFPTERDPDVLQRMSELLASGESLLGTCSKKYNEHQNWYSFNYDRILATVVLFLFVGV